MRDNNDRFFDAFEEIARVLRDRPGRSSRGPSESVVDAAERARRDRALEASEVNLIADCAPLRNSLAHHRVNGRTMLVVTDEVLTRIEKLRCRLAVRCRPWNGSAARSPPCPPTRPWQRPAT